MAQNITLMNASYTAVPAVTLPKTGGGTATFTDVTDTTAAASDVASGKYFYTAAGVKTEGTGGGGGGSRTTIIPEQTLNASSAVTYITNYKSPLVIGESYYVTVNGTEKELTCINDGNPSILYDGEDIEFVYVNGNMVFYLDKSSLYGTYTVKVEQDSGGGGSTLIEKTITANGVYNASDDNADGYSKVTVNVSGGGGGGKNVQVAHGTKRVASQTYTDVDYEITVAKTGTYNVYWAGWRSSTSGTNGAQLYVNGTASGDAVTTFDSTWTNVQNGSRTNVSLTANDKVTLRARSRGNSYYMYIFFLSIEEA